MLFTIPTSVIQIRLDYGWALVHNTDVDTAAGNDIASSNGRIHFNIGNIF